jgi:hypothetical protein
MKSKTMKSSMNKTKNYPKNPLFVKKKKILKINSKVTLNISFLLTPKSMKITIYSLTLFIQIFKLPPILIKNILTILMEIFKDLHHLYKIKHNKFKSKFYPIPAIHLEI